MMRDKTRLVSRKADIMLLLVAAAWGTSYGLAKEAVTLYPVLGFLVVRFLLTTLMLLKPLISQCRRDLSGLMQAGVPTGLILLTVFLCETFGVMNTTASNAAVLISLCVIMTPFVEWIILKRAPTRRIWLIVTLSMLGVFAMSEGFSFRLSFGDALILLAALMRALMVTMTRKLTRYYSGTTTALTAVQSLVVTLGCLSLAFIFRVEAVLDIPSGTRFWLITTYLVCVCTVLAFFVQNYAVRRVSPTRVSVLMGSEPLFGVMFAVYWLGEQLTVSALVGMGLIIISSFLMIMTREDHQKNSSLNVARKQVDHSPAQIQSR